MINVKLPDGSNVSFPDGMSEGEITQILDQHLAPKAENSLAGTMKAIGSGAVQGGAELLGLPADIISAVNPAKAEALKPYGSEAITKRIEDQMTGPLYKPQTGFENFASGVAKFIPGAAFPAPGGVTGRVLANVVAPGVATEAAKAVTDNPYVIAGAGLAGLAGATKAGRLAEGVAGRRALPPVQTAEQLDASVSPAFNTQALKDARLSYPETQAGFNIIENDLKSQYFDATPGSPTAPVYNALKASPLNGTEFSFQDLHNVRKRLGEIASGPDKSARNAAGQAIEQLDQIMKNLAQTAVTKGDAVQAATDLQNAIGLAGANFRSQRVQDFIERATNNAAATHSGANLENEIYKQVRNALNNPNKLLRGWDADEKEALRGVLPGAVANFNRRVSKYLGGGGGLGQLVTSSAGYGAFGPAGLALPAIGLATNKLGSLAAVKRLEAVGELIRARTPQYAKHYQRYVELKSMGKNPRDYLPAPAVAAIEAALAASPAQVPEVSK